MVGNAMRMATSGFAKDWIESSMTRYMAWMETLSNWSWTYASRNYSRMIYGSRSWSRFLRMEWN
jgi:hypothetical protein